MRIVGSSGLWVSHLSLAGLLFAAGVSAQKDAPYMLPPIDYGNVAPRDPVAELGRRIAQGEQSLAHAPGTGYLEALLAAIGAPQSSQGLVFSKTSFQNTLISPDNPRAVFFGDEVYVGYVPGGKVLEITAMDPVQGPIFYTLDQQSAKQPKFVQRTGECLACHGSTRTKAWPGHLVRSVFTKADGHPRTNAGSFVTTHQSRYENRWGGWYVTGSHGAMRHLGNTTVQEDQDVFALDRSKGANVQSVADRIDPARYLSAHSDIVALMVLEHQTHVQNVITRAGYVVRRALHLQKQTNSMLGEPEDRIGETTKRVIESAAESVVAGLFLKGEPVLPAPVRGTSTFAEDFQKRGPRDSANRSLRELDLKKRLFRLPCSYVIYSPSFDALPELLLDRVWSRMGRILSGRASRKVWRLTKSQRTAIREILAETKPGAPREWSEGGR